MKYFLYTLFISSLLSQVLEKQNKLLWDGTDWNSIERKADVSEKSVYRIKSAYLNGLLDGRLYYYLKAWTVEQEFADSLYSDKLDYLTTKETIRQLDRFYEERLMVYVPVISAIIIVHMQAEQVPKRVIDLYIDETKYWINRLTLDMEEEGMRKLLELKQNKYVK